MTAIFHHKHYHTGAHHRLWLILAAVIAFLFAALWTQPIH